MSGGVWEPVELTDNDLPEHYVTGKVDGIVVSLQIRVGAPSSVLHPLALADRIAVVLNKASEKL